jgi:hypothetical protein
MFEQEEENLELPVGQGGPRYPTRRSGVSGWRPAGEVIRFHVPVVSLVCIPSISQATLCYDQTRPDSFDETLELRPAVEKPGRGLLLVHMPGRGRHSEVQPSSRLVMTTSRIMRG